MMELIGILFYFITSCLWAQSGAPSHLNHYDRASLQRGAGLFMNYCSGCHSLAYLRYNQMAVGLGINNPALLRNNLIFTQAGSVEPIQIALPSEDAQQWFGRIPPDLSLVSRQKGALWIYHYLTGFYGDKTRPFGVNNIVVPNVAMPDVLEPLRGKVQLDILNHKPVLKNIQQGDLSPIEFEQAVTDLVHFLVYVSEPTRVDRYRLGPYVLLFLIILLVPVYCLNRMYWRKTIRTL